MKHLELYSDLGKELMILKNIKSKSFDPTTVKDILVLAEDTRIAVRKSEIISLGLNKQEIERQLKNIDNLYLNLRNGQQCVRDFFLCLKENLENWIDVYQLFSLNMINTTKCRSCGKTNESEQNQLYVEIDVPPTDSRLNEYVEESLNNCCNVDYDCKEGCHMKHGAENRSMIKSCKETDVIIVMLRRVIQDESGPILLQRSTHSTFNIFVRYSNNK